LLTHGIGLLNLGRVSGGPDAVFRALPPVARGKVGWAIFAWQFWPQAGFPAG